MIAGRSVDLSIGAFVERFPGVTTECRTCNTWEERAYDRSLRAVDRAVAWFASDDWRPPRSRGGSAARTGDESDFPTGDEGGWRPWLSDQALDKVERLMQWFDLEESTGPPRRHEDVRRPYDFDLPPYDDVPDIPRFSREFHGLAPLVGVVDRCGFVSPGSSPLAPPPFLAVAGYTQTCFTDVYTKAAWPETDCEAPCLAAIAKPCLVPDPSSIMAIELVDAGHWYAQQGATGGNVLFSRSEADAETALLGAAVALLRENRDLVLWVTCLALSWSWRANEDDKAAGLAYVDAALDGAVKIFIVGTAANGATGWATGVGEDWLEPAVVMPMEADPWVSAVTGYQAFAGTGQENGRALCAVAAVAQTILHELLHLAFPTVEASPDARDHIADDANQCFATQNMAGISLLWALAQRYPCLKPAGCCPKSSPLYFMTSEPDGVGEPAPWDWDPSAPC